MSMLVVVIENVPPRSRGRLAIWLLEVRAGVYIGGVSAKIRGMVWEQTAGLAEGDDVMMAWATNTEMGFELQIFGLDRHAPIDLDGLRLVSSLPV